MGVKKMGEGHYLPSTLTKRTHFSFALPAQPQLPHIAHLLGMEPAFNTMFKVLYTLLPKISSIYD